ncbi:hypothetical protein IT568_07350 [bacterium]|nr:hypothetical protein [bacterium]
MRIKNLTFAVFFSMLSVSFADDLGKISGKVFFDYSLQTKDGQKINGQKTMKNENAFQFSRIIFTYKKNISDNLETVFQTDVQKPSSEGYELFIKNMLLDWKLNPNTSLIFGMQSYHAFKRQEEIWGHRDVAKTVVDELGWHSSADLGVSAKGSLFNDALNYQTSIVNGQGFKKTENDKYKKFGLTLDFYPVRNFDVLGFVAYEPQGKDFKGKNFATMILSGFLGFEMEKFYSAGIEFNLQKNDSYTKDNNTSKIDNQAVSVYSTYWVTEKIGVFGRVDLVEPNKDVDDDEFNNIFFGLKHRYNKNFSIALDYKTTTYKDSKAKRDEVVATHFEFKF